MSEESLRDLWPTGSLDLLKALHILTRDGKLNQDSKRKLKQVKHLVQLITPHADDFRSFVDLGAGKSYLGFLLYDLFLATKAETRLWAVEQREDLIKTCQSIAKSSGFERINFVCKSISQSLVSEELPESVDVVTALHACDTATDQAIQFALHKDAKFIALVPCCQAEVAKLLNDIPKFKSPQLAPLWTQKLHCREFGSHITNVIRCLFLESHGYKVRVTELIGWEHSLKNEIILAEKIQKTNPLAQRQLDFLLESFPLHEMSLLKKG